MSFHPGQPDNIEEVTDLTRWLRRVKRDRAFHDLDFCMALATIDEIKIYGRPLRPTNVLRKPCSTACAGCWAIRLSRRQLTHARSFHAGGAFVAFTLNAERSSQWRFRPCTKSSVSVTDLGNAPQHV